MFGPVIRIMPLPHVWCSFGFTMVEWRCGAKIRTKRQLADLFFVSLSDLRVISKKHRETAAKLGRD